MTPPHATSLLRARALGALATSLAVSSVAVSSVAVSSAAFAQGGPPPPPPPITPPPGPGPVTIQVPAANPITAAKANLGKALFWDAQLSSTGVTACGSCHLFGAGGADPRSADPLVASTHPGLDAVFGTPDDVRGSRGVPRSLADGSYAFDAVHGLEPQVTARQAPPALNAAGLGNQFWDGRASGPLVDPLTGATTVPGSAGLENQVLGPPLSDAEMAHETRDWSEVLAALQGATPLAFAADVPPALEAWIADRDYPALFDEAFGDPQLTASRVAMAIATYERTLISDQTPDDAFRNGDPTALTPQQALGRQIFYGPAGCGTCHSGVFYSDDDFHYIGVRPQGEDLGRFEVTGQVADRGAMRTPGLRNVGLSAPYFHNGRMNSLEDVVAFYNRGGDFDAPNKHPLIRPLGLSVGQQAALVAYLRDGLTDPRVAQELAPFDGVRLFEQDAELQARKFGAGTAGTGGATPRMVCHEPPALGNPDFTVAVDRGLGGARAFLLVSTRDQVLGVPFRGAMSHVALHSGRSRWLAAGQLTGIGGGQGYGSRGMTLPTSSAYRGTSLYAQWFVIDPGAPNGLAASEALEVTLF